MNDYYPFLVPGILFIFTVGFGIWVARLGKPYNQILFNLHKLIALAGVILVVLRIIDLDPFYNFQVLVPGSLLGAFLAVIGLFTTGAVMSIREDEVVIIKWFHRGSLVLLILSSMLAIFSMF